VPNATQPSQAAVPSPSAALATTTDAPFNRPGRAPNPAFDDLRRPSKRRAADSQPPALQVVTSLSELPETFLVGALQYQGGRELDGTLTLSKRFAALTNEARRQRVVTLAQRPGRIVQEKLPTWLELSDMGVGNPNMGNVLKTMQPVLPAGEGGPLTRNARAYARMRQVARLAREFGGLAWRIGAHHADIGQMNAQRQTHGFGIRVYRNEQSLRYRGNFRNGLPHGLGYVDFIGGTRFEGMFENYQKHGQGTFFYANNDRFEGMYENDQRHGQGTSFYANGDRFEGMFENDQRHGQGTSFYVNGDRFEGMFENGLAHGRCTKFFADGTRFEVTYENGQAHGQGTVFFANGDRAELMYQNNQQQGEFIYVDGSIFEEEIGTDSSSKEDKS